mmetsp:Transcript_42487/g.117235  ORF Transcript_42487/g.117235 Transcript_42487/m.117235 type:complete len:252 (-) Transcript_42487:225-980(-)
MDLRIRVACFLVRLGILGIDRLLEISLVKFLLRLRAAERLLCLRIRAADWIILPASGVLRRCRRSPQPLKELRQRHVHFDLRKEGDDRLLDCFLDSPPGVAATAAYGGDPRGLVEGPVEVLLFRPPTVGAATLHEDFVQLLVGSAMRIRGRPCLRRLVRLGGGLELELGRIAVSTQVDELFECDDVVLFFADQAPRDEVHAIFEQAIKACVGCAWQEELPGERQGLPPGAQEILLFGLPAPRHVALSKQLP